MGGLGGILFISNVHWIMFSVGIGHSTNNRVEMLAFKLLLLLALSKAVLRLYVLGESKLEINWMDFKRPLENNFPRPIYEELISISRMFEVINFNCIYRKRNTMVD